jgi:outer membrane protein assembly factor BamB
MKARPNDARARAPFRRTVGGFVAAIAVVAGATVPGTAAPQAMPPQRTQIRLNPASNPVIAFAGAPQWTVQTKGPISASPAVVGGTLYLGNNRGELDAIDVATGRVRWTFHVRNPLMSNPLVYDGIVIVGEGNANSTTYVPRRKVEVGDGPNALLGINAASGTLAWRTPLNGTAMPTPVIENGLLVEDDGSGEITALTPSTGHIVYQHRMKSVASMVGLLPLPGGLAVTAGIFPNRVFAVDAANGKLAWQYPLSERDSGVGDCPPVSNGVDIFGDYVAPLAANGEAGVGVESQQRVYALDAHTGRPLWNVGLESGMVPPRNEVAIPLVVGNRLYLGSAIAPFVHAIDTATGRVLWTAKVGGPVKGGIVEHDGRLYFGDFAGNVWALDARTGAVVGMLKTSTPFNVDSPIVVGLSVIIGSKTGSITAIPIDRITASHPGAG